MKRHILMCALAAAAVVGAVQSARTDEAAKTEDANAHGFRLLAKVLKEAPDGNIAFSPFSADQALAMAWFAADGETKRQIGDGIGLTPTQDVASVRERFAVTKEAGHELLTANVVGVGTRVSAAASFDRDIGAALHGKVETVDFAKPGAAVKAINGWIGEKTKGAVKGVLSERDFDSLTAAVIVNAVTFKGLWPRPFRESDFQMRYFQPAGNRPRIPVEMMCRDVDALYYVNPEAEKKVNLGQYSPAELKEKKVELQAQYEKYADEDFRAVVLPYRGDGAHAVFILPPLGMTMDEAATRLADGDYARIMRSLDYDKKVAFALPRFRIEETFSLVDPLKELGMGEMFDDMKADFPALRCSVGPVFVKDVRQKAMIQVDENGTEASAETMIDVELGLHPFVEFKRVFRLERPFIMVVEDVPDRDRWERRRVLFSCVVSDAGKVALPEILKFESEEARRQAAEKAAQCVTVPWSDGEVDQKERDRIADEEERARWEKEKAKRKAERDRKKAALK